MIDENKERLLELLAEQTIFGLDESEVMELEQLKKQIPDWRSFDNFETAAAAISLTNLKIVPLPDYLRQKVLNDADDFFGFAGNDQKVLNFEADRKKSPITPVAGSVGGNILSLPKRPFWQWFGWGIAAAACALLIANLWLTRFQNSPVVADLPKSIQTPTPEFSVIQKREQFLTTAADVIKTNLVSPTGATNISGDVVWSNSLQKGYITFRGLPANDPNKSTYQLWVVDESQDPKTPIDCGIFDIRQSGEIIIPINAKLQVKNPKLFAVTEEKPGGVVVSKRDKLIVIAKV